VVIKLGDQLQVVKAEAVSNLRNTEICSRILEYMTNFNIVRIGLDQGNGAAVLDLFREGRPQITKGGKVKQVKLLPILDDTGAEGQRIIEVFAASSPSVTDLNFKMKNSMETGYIKWPKIAGDYDEDTIGEREELIDQIKGMEKEFRMVEAKQTGSGWYSFSVPHHKNKDRYSAALFAHGAAKGYLGNDESPIILARGFWRSDMGMGWY
jgi:hypothetical protein